MERAGKAARETRHGRTDRLALGHRPSLPARTQAAFAASVAIGLAWAGFAAWVLAKTRVLFANHRIHASRMATAFSGLFLVGSIVFRDHLGVGAIATSAVLFAIACASLVLTHQRFTRLIERRRALESGQTS
jgi:hypothetical protein